MSTPPAPPQAELADRPFSFYPPIHGVENNEWRLTEATWSEMVVRNTREAMEVAIPRRYFGAVSETDKPVMIVGLKQELEYRMGTVWPVKRTVLSMPSPTLKPPPGQHTEPAPGEPTGLGAILGISSQGTDSRITRLIGMTFLGLVGLVFVVWAVMKLTPQTKPTFIAKDQSYLELNKDDDYFAIVRKLGKPAEDHWKPNSGEIQYQALYYPQRGYAVILMGGKREDVRYIGAMGLGPDGKGWAPLHSVDFSHGANTMSMLRTMPRF
ncbi:MAG: hypothetical protein HY821_21165 [Acidobacteria bacterium]|nr:hypothetical protein [Acidobacteriota bacterium]